MKVAVFGGASAKPGDAVYEEARQLGNLLGEKGYTVMTGGYIGVMEAASRGANEAGGHVIGVTCEEIECWRGVKANEWVKEESKYVTLRERMYGLIDGCDAAIVMPGGVGTLAELSVMWNELIIAQRPARPLILVGKEWHKLIYQWIETFGSFIPEKEMKRIELADTIETAVELLGSHKQSS